MLTRKITTIGDEFGNGERVLTPETVNKLRWWEVGARERVMKLGGEMVRQQLFEKIHDSSLGIALYRGVTERLKGMEGRIDSPIALSKIGNNIAIDVVERLSDENFSLGNRNLTNPDFIHEQGGLCVEASMAAEAAMHLTYSMANPRPDFSGYTQEVVLRTVKEGGDTGHHMVLRSVL